MLTYGGLINCRLWFRLHCWWWLFVYIIFIVLEIKKRLLEMHEVICISDISLLPGVIDHPNHLQLSFQQWAHFVVVVEGVYHHSLSVAPGASSIEKY